MRYLSRPYPMSSSWPQDAEPPFLLGTYHIAKISVPPQVQRHAQFGRVYPRHQPTRPASIADTSPAGPAPPHTVPLKMLRRYQAADFGIHPWRLSRDNNPMPCE
ncbi:hypothetical protein BDI4_590057 [Burkholderia diffusa]|nr:hypothetical protein BDI4_590057 [Burkholderia diffusa]